MPEQQIISTYEDETFKPDGDAEIDFTRAAGGYFGQDTVVMKKGAALNLKVADGFTGSIKNGSIVLESKSDLRYIVKARVTGIGDAPAMLDGHEIPAELIDADGCITFYTSISTMVGTNGSDIEAGDYVFATDPIYMQGEGNNAIPVKVMLQNSSFATDSWTFSGMTFSDLHVYKVAYNGDYDSVFQLQDITNAYKAAIANAEEGDYSYNQQLFSSVWGFNYDVTTGEMTPVDKLTQKNTVTLQDFIKMYNGSEITVNGTNITDLTFNVAMDEGKTTYNGTWLNEKIASTDADEVFNMGKGKNEIDFTKAGNYFGDDTIKLTKGEELSIVTSDAELEYGVDGKDIIISVGDEGDIRLVGAAVKDIATIKVNGTDLSTIENLFNYNVAGVQENKGVVNGSVLSDYMDMRTYQSTNGKGVKINSKSGNDTIIGSNYNDTIKAGSLTDEVAKVTEYAGINKITTGKGDDEINIAGMSSNKINAGAGDNKIRLQDGYNIVKSGKDQDEYTISGGINSIKSGMGGDVYNITGGQNTIKTGNDITTFDIAGGKNVITAGKKADEFTVSGGNNILKGGKGDDIYNVILGDQGLNFNDGSLFINDKAGANRLNITGNEAEYINLFFDVTAKGKMSNFVFSEGEDFGSAGISVANEKSIESIRYGGVTYHIDINEIKQLAADIAAWLGENNYATTADAIADGQGDVLSEAFRAFAAHDYEFRAANSLMN